MTSKSSTVLYSLDLRSVRSMITAAIFVAGNIVLPQIVHFIPNGGHIWLPIYFFTLVGAYKYGFGVGLLTAVLSPLVNCVLFGMPEVAALPGIMLKSIALAVCAAYAARRSGGVSLVAIVLAVAGCQLVGGCYDWLTDSMRASVQNLTTGLPGIIMQIFGSYFLLRNVLKD